MEAGIGIVVIGRNEGDRLVSCLDSLTALATTALSTTSLTSTTLTTGLVDPSMIVYVDSGSSGSSCEKVRARGLTVLELDPQLPFTAARARNTGFEWLTQQFPALEYVQFIDGDCQLFSDWVQKALDTFKQSESLAIVCGRRREQYPEASIYNQLADMEWNTPIGKAKACGGDALVRVKAIQAVGGYNPKLICGEEPEMCIRLRQQGWTIERIDADMTYHDAAMDQFSQWWKRSIRGGWAVAEGYAMYGDLEEKYMAREHFSGFLWGGIVPFMALGLAWFSHGFSLLLLAGYLVLAYKIYRFRYQYGDSAANSRRYAYFCTLSKIPQLFGQIQFWVKRLRGTTNTLIEYKTVPKSGQID
jgi:GT2 family glycosyltransferase